MIDYISNIIKQIKTLYNYDYNEKYNYMYYINYIEKKKIKFDDLTKEDLEKINSFNQRNFLINQLNSNYFVGKVDRLEKKEKTIIFNIEGFIGTLYDNLEILLYNITTKQSIQIIVKKIIFNNIIFTKIDGKTIIELSETFNNGIINELFFKNSVNLTLKNVNSLYSNIEWDYTCQVECYINEDIDITNSYIIIDKKMKEYNKNLLIELTNI